jgi:hypothetical protein
VLSPLPSPQDIIAIADDACLDVWGELTQYTVGGVTYEPTGIFEAAYVWVQAGQAGVQSQGPAVFYQRADLPSDPQEVEPTQIVIRGTAYRVIEVKNDGQTGVLLRLHKKA